MTQVCHASQFLSERGNPMSVPLCIYHGNCQDGFGAAWTVRHALGDRVEFYPGIYQNEPPDVTGRDVIIVDFSYKRPVIEAMALKAHSILILDHHKSTAADLGDFWRAPSSWAAWSAAIAHAPLSQTYRVAVVFDMGRSGAGIAWDYFVEGARLPLIDHIEDRDLWRFKLPKTREIAASLFSYPYDFGLWDSLMREDFLPHLIAEGQGILRRDHQDIANLLPVVQRQMRIGDNMMPVANLPLTLASDAGHKMASEDLAIRQLAIGTRRKAVSSRSARPKTARMFPRSPSDTAAAAIGMPPVSECRSDGRASSKDEQVHVVVHRKSPKTESIYADKD
jgi:uncharacterized protein